MLKIDNSINIKNVSGKKVRRASYLPTVIICWAMILFMAATVIFWIKVSLPAALIIIPGAVLACWCASFVIRSETNDVHCVLGDDKLYFFSTYVTNEARKQLSGAVNGWVDYSEISDLEYHYDPTMTKRSRKYVTFRACGYTFKMLADKALVVLIKKRLESHPYSPSKTEPHNESAPRVDDGVWGQILADFYSGKLEHIWDEGTTVTGMYYDETGNSINITIQCDAIDYAVVADADSVYIQNTCTGEDKSLSISRYKHTESLYERINRTVHTAT